MHWYPWLSRTGQRHY